ncbi:hypothetical protein [Marinobacterium litorale]|uniref:hypothetical protein n=1 Tax=Marinobacterium litorale TaxID=404770 RepID=UPI0004079F52|nr:hypothetical protein [Marinobacterium litorale]
MARSKEQAAERPFNDPLSDRVVPNDSRPKGQSEAQHSGRCRAGGHRHPAPHGGEQQQVRARPEAGHYELTIPYRSDTELDKTVYDLLTEISQEAYMRNCFIEADAWEVGTERRW